MLEEGVFGVSLYDLSIILFAILFALFIRGIFAKLIVLKLKKIIRKTSNNLDDKESKTILEKPKNILSPEDQFQLAMDSMRKKNYIEANNLFKEFIGNNQSNQLSGSAYYWLGKLQILEKNFRESVITLAEGHEKFPESIKAPDMLYDLSQSLIRIDKINEACNIMDILIKKHPKNK